MLWYPVQRQRLPSSPSRISRSVGFGFSVSRPTAAITMPGVQKPHCSPCSARNAAGIGCRSSPSAESPSNVVTDWPSTCTASRVHDFTDSPSSSTVQAPQDVVSQPMLVALSPTTSRR